MGKVVSTIILSLLFIPALASALTLTPAGPEASGYMHTNNVTVVSSTDGWLYVQAPDGTRCQLFYGVSNGDGIGAFGSLGDGGTLYNYLNDTPGRPCGSGTGNAITDYSQDGTWIVQIYSDDLFTTLAEDTTFCQGDCVPHVPGVIDMNRHIRFETFQAMSFSLAASMFLWMLIHNTSWFFSRLFRRSRRGS